MIGFMVEFVVFVICVVIIVLILQWGMAKLGWALDPTLKMILGLVLFLICLLFFLNMTGHLTGNGFRF
jgi:hypothetical protein